MKTLHTFLTLLLVLMMSSLQTLSAQENKDGKTSDIPAPGWYVGIDGGVPFGFSSFSSFGKENGSRWQ